MAPDRRDFLKGLSAAALAGASLNSGMAQNQQSSLRNIQTDVLNIAYEEHGDGNGFPIILLHGFPYDIRSFDGVTQPLAQAGYRILVPYLRGFGPTRFLAPNAPRMAQQAAIAQDLIDFADVLNLDQFATAGFDWGNRAACITSILHPQRVRAQVAIGGYSVQNTLTPGTPAAAQFEALLWYQWYFNTDRGVVGLQQNRHDIVRYLWKTWSPQWDYSDEAYNRSAPSFDNPDFVEVVIHSYRHRHVNAPGEERFEEVERQLATRPQIEVPTIVLRGAASGFGPPALDPSFDQNRFTNLLARYIVQGAGHDMPVQRPDAVVDALLELL